MLAGAEVLFTFADPRITESSALAASASADWLWTANDSGDSARLFAVGPDGRTLQVTTLPGTRVTDVEDLAIGPDRTLYVGDIGDNRASRASVSVLRVPEPAVDPARHGVRRDTGPPTRTMLTYEDGPHDAETLLLSPRTGQVLVVTKQVLGSGVYAAPQPLTDGVLRRVGSLPLELTGTPGGPGIGSVAQLLATGGAVSPDGRRVVVRTYTDAYVWDVPGDDLAAALRQAPRVVPLPPTRQGEAVTFSADGAALLTSSEGRSAPVHRVPLPPPPAGSPALARTAPETAPVTAPESPVARGLPRGLLLGGAAMAALVVTGLVLRRRRG